MKLKQVEPTRVTIGDMDFYIRPFPAFKAANMTGELASVLAPLLSALVPMVSEASQKEEKEGPADLLDMDAGKVAEVMMNGTAIHGDQLEKLMKKLLLGGHIAVEIEGEDGDKEATRLTQDLADEIFCGDVQEMFVLCFHVIKLNYSRFFGKFANQFGKAKSEGKKTPRKIL